MQMVLCFKSISFYYTKIKNFSLITKISQIWNYNTPFIKLFIPHLFRMEHQMKIGSYRCPDYERYAFLT